MEIKMKQTIQQFLVCFWVLGLMGTVSFAEDVPSDLAPSIPPPMEKGLVKKKVSAFQKRVEVPTKPPLGTGLTNPMRYMHHGRQDKIERQVGPGTPEFVRRQFVTKPLKGFRDDLKPKVSQ